MAQRDDKGRFIKGVSGNPAGRPPRATEEEYLEVTIGSVSLERWGRIVAKAAEQAEEGDDKARKWLGDYILGKPEQAHKLSGGESVTVRLIYPDDAE